MTFWSRILDFLCLPIPSLPPQSCYDHIALCDLTNCDISGDEWMVRRFVEIVNETIAKGQMCLLYAEPSEFGSAFADPRKIWPQMRDAHFRDVVQLLLPYGEFCAPDDLGGWVFVMYPRQSA